MALSTIIKHQLNLLLRPLNIRLDTWTKHNQEVQRISSLDKVDYFNKPVFPIPLTFKNAETSAIFAGLKRYEKTFDTWRSPNRNPVGYSFDNEYYSSPDAEVLYTILRTYQPSIYLEIGSGNSTKIARLAINDGKLATKITSIDPKPRIEIDELSDFVIRKRIEEGWDNSIFRKLKRGDILFIDSSHLLLPGNDTVFLYLNVLPYLSSGVLIHIHDIFLPYDYPSDWVGEENRNWNEQYLVHSMLMFSEQFQTLWPGYYLQQQDAMSFKDRFKHIKSGQRAQSLWLQKK